MAVELLKGRIKALTALRVTLPDDANGVGDMDKVTAETHMDILETMYANCDRQYATIMIDMGISDAQKQECAEMLQGVIDPYTKGKVALQRRLYELAPVAPQGAPRFDEGRVLEVVSRREPRIGKFNGDPHAWPAFRDQFIAEVHERKDLKGVTKLTFLKAACISTAAVTLGLWDHTDDSYDGAWALMRQHYDDPYSIMMSLIAKITALPVLKVETYESLNNIVSVIKSVFRQLNNMQVETNGWDPIVSI